MKSKPCCLHSRSSLLAFSQCSSVFYGSLRLPTCSPGIPTAHLNFVALASILFLFLFPCFSATFVVLPASTVYVPLNPAKPSPELIL